jgi:hypothetical protein
MKIGARRRIKLPHSRLGRLVVGIALVIGGILGFLPVLGFWMVPLGLAVLSVDIPYIRRRRRRFQVWWGRRFNNRTNGTRNNGGKPAAGDGVGKNYN